MTTPRTLESIALTTLKKGKVFFSYKQDKDMTAISSYYGKRIKTERMVLMHPITFKVERITKITIL
jgi:DNA primase